MQRRRTEIHILHDILQLIEKKGGVAKPTHILYGANLSHKRMMGYIEFLEGRGFIEKVPRGEKTTYRITDKGKKFLSEFKKIEELSNAFGIGL
ncbi:MAG TPA: winged helix-turn-helix domain-containing protein [archaeon]|nr:winged helix-turn-helix domain-containing protein [archaeon]